MKTLSIETPTHGRVLLRSGLNSSNRVPISVTPVVIVGFHGYAQSAEDMMETLEALPGSEAWTLAAVQGLHRFYTRGDQKVVASWMTRQDREESIADNIVYCDRVLDAVREQEIGTQFEELSPDLLFLGFSQGVAMAYRAALLGRHRVAGIIAIGGDVPPDVKGVPAERWPRVHVAAGTTDQWYTPEKVAADESFLRDHGVAHEIFRYDAGHVITDDVLARVAAFVA